MPNYYTKQDLTKSAVSQNDAEDSEYESDDDTRYKVGGVIGVGNYARARLLVAPGGKKRVVLNPVARYPDTFYEAERKQQFFMKRYSEQQSMLFRREETINLIKGPSYRLVLPYISGLTYSQFLRANGHVDHIVQQCNIFLSLIRELKVLHSTGLVCVDMNLSNLIFDEKTGKSYVIDGGLSVESGQHLLINYSRNTQEELAKYVRAYPLHAPECWTLKGRPPAIAATSMDVYAMAAILRLYVFDHSLDSCLLRLLRSCRVLIPTERPSLDKLEEQVNQLKRDSIYEHYQAYIQSIDNKEPNVLLRFIGYIAQHFVLNEKMKRFDAERHHVKPSYLLSTFAPPEQHLLMELAGCIFFTALKHKKLGLLSIPTDYSVELQGDMLKMIYCTGQFRIIPRWFCQIREHMFIQKHVHIKFSECTQALTGRIKAHPQYLDFVISFIHAGLLEMDPWGLMIENEAVRACQL